ncbi:replication initiation factor domain-containing protein [Methylobacillus caricis]|uniref:replication initiation factor domain-containing protein n=1 Tax=Methylobacillus caricis TaxID=1971611 RepID=UPI001CFF84C8|nr:replication initiation factor domain-containing protein [Methylobacillus caricis]MCB5187511.1 replication initiation factor domain-containing protein [Methylobacillus caricis]
MQNTEGASNNGGRTPDIEHRGNWKNPNGKGRTLYVGHRSNGRYFRGYEKGKQLGDPNSPWIRLEVELKSVDRIIPLDILKQPQDYFAAAYPLLSRFSREPQRIDTIRKTTQISYERTKKWLKRQCGAALHLMLNVEGNAERVLDLIMREGKIPKGILPPSFRNVGQSLHHLPRDFAPMAISTLA